ncbi:hypothetical protein IE53DRAFT_372398, partial [Violaceomyces palustris]
YREAATVAIADQVARRFFTLERVRDFESGISVLVSQTSAGLIASMLAGRDFDDDHHRFVTRVQGLLQNLGIFHLDDTRTGVTFSPRKDPEQQAIKGATSWSLALASLLVSFTAPVHLLGVDRAIPGSKIL